MRKKLLYLAWMLLIVEASAVQGLGREGNPPSEVSIPKVRLQISVARPFSYSSMEYYKPLYGNPSVYPQMSVEWLFVSTPHFQLGLGGSVAYSVSNGNAGVAPKGTKGVPSADTIERDPNSPSTLTILPYRLFASMTIYPVPNEIIGIGLFGGVEEIYFGETRSLPTTTSTTGGTTTTTATKDPQARTGWSKGLVMGASLPILLAGPTSGAIRAMSLMRAHAIHFTPFYERVSKLPGDRLWLARKTDSKLKFFRQNVGISFTFDFK